MNYKINDAVDLSTVTFYTITSGLCFALGLLLMVFTLMLKGTVLTRISAWVLMTMALAFFLAGAAPNLPTWLPVVVVNVLLLISGLQLYSGVRAFVTQQALRVDWIGMLVVALAVPPLLYWWFIDSDGIRRAIVFSSAAMLINARSAYWLIGHLRQQRFRLPLFFMTLVLAVFSVWMGLRVLYLVYLAMAEPLPAELRAANPTSWSTVFTLNLLIALFVASLLAAEIEGRYQRRRARALNADDDGDALREKLRLIGGIVSVILISILAEMGIAYLVTYQHERAQLEQENIVANRALTDHSQQLIYQADLVLRSTRYLVEKQYAVADLDRFVRSLAVPKAFFEGVFVLNAQGDLILPERHEGASVRAFHREYFRVHWDNPEDQLYVGPVTMGQVTGKKQFRISRRIQDAQGRFAGVVFLPLEPMDFTEHYTRILQSTDKVVSLMGTQDRLARAALSIVDLERMQKPLDTPLWSHLAEMDGGIFQNLSPVDGRLRQFYFQRLQDLPLVMVTGYSDADVHRSTWRALRSVVMGVLLAVIGLLTLTYLLVRALQRHDEQQRFLAMISHELRTPMSVISMELGPQKTSGESLGRVRRAIGEMSAIIDSTLQADQLSHQQLQVRSARCDLSEMLTTICASLQTPERMRLQIDPVPTVDTDAQLMKIVLTNLLDNAIKYSPADSLVLVRAKPKAVKGVDGVEVTVRSAFGPTGAPDAKRVFRKFYRAPGARRRTGSGLGLYIAEGLMRLLGGSLRYVPEDEVACFILWLPQRCES